MCLRIKIGRHAKMGLFSSTPDLPKEDYVQALDNLTKLHSAVIEEKKSLEARNNHLRGAIETMKEQATARENIIVTLREKIETLKDILADLRQTPSGFTSDIESLVSARYAFKSGNMNDGMYELEKVLNGADSSWHTRAP